MSNEDTRREIPSPSAESEKTSSEAAETPPPACAPGVSAESSSPDHNGAAGSSESPNLPTHADPAAPSPPPDEQLVEALPEAPKLLILPGDRSPRSDALPEAPRRNGAKAAAPATATVKAPAFERDSPALVECRDALRSLVELLEAEIKDARLAKDNTAQKLMPRSLENFIQALASNLRDAKVLYAAAYANTLEDRYDAIQPRIVHARTLAARAGLKLPAARG